MPLALGIVVAALLIVGIVAFVKYGQTERPPVASPSQAGATAPRVAAVDPAAVVRSPLARPANPSAQTSADPCLALTQARPDEDVTGAARRYEQTFGETRQRVKASLRARGDDLSLAISHLLDIDNPAMPHELARLASSSADKRVYMLALQTCHGRSDGNCQLITPEQWAERDPSNAVPWLQVMAAAQDRGDTAAADAAMRRAADATIYDTGYGTLVGPVLAERKDDPASLVGMYGPMSDVVGAQAAWAMPHYQSTRSYCRGAALGGGKWLPMDPSRVPLCLRVAEVMTMRSNALIDRAIGNGLGELAGWPAERVQQIRAETRELSLFGMEASVDPLTRGCAALRQTYQQLEDTHRLGELEARRRAIEASGTSLAERVERRLRAASAGGAGSGAVATGR